MLRTHNCGELNLINIKQEVVLTGWVQKTRDLGGMTFIDLRDRYGITQLAFNIDINPEFCTNARKLGREFVIQVNGIVIERTSKNSALKTGPHTEKLRNESERSSDNLCEGRRLPLDRKPVEKTAEL